MSVANALVLVAVAGALGPLDTHPALAQTTTPGVSGIVARVTAQGTGSVSWSGFPKAVSYFVVRWNTGDASCCKGTSPPALGMATLSWQDGTLPKPGTYAYRVYATTAAGTYAGETKVYYEPGLATTSESSGSGGAITLITGAPTGGSTSGLDPASRTSLTPMSNTSTATPTAPADPTEFSASQGGEGEVALSWKDVPGVTKYLISGPGAGNGVTVPSNAPTSFSFPTGPTTGKSTYTLKGVPLGSQTWTIASVYEPGGVLTSSDKWPKATLTVETRSGRYRVTMFAFLVNTQTKEGLALDGRGDEVYLAAYVASSNLATQTWGPKGVVRSIVFGDVFGATGRVLAGSVSADGGLRTGDVFPVGGGTAAPAAPTADRLPLLLWEGQLTDDVDLLLIAPAIWESDNDDYNFSGWSSATTSNIQNAFQWSALVSEISATGINPVRGGGAPSISKTGPVVDHPIGITTTVYYSQYYLALTRKKIEETLSSSTRVGGLAPGVIAVALSDQATLENFGGAYTIYLRVERVP